MKRTRTRAAGVYATCAALAVLFLTPMLWALYSSLRGRTGTGALGLSNYRRLLDYGSGLQVYMANTAFVALITVTVTVVATTLGGYAFARFSFPGKNLLFMLTLTILMVPHSTILIPLYIMLDWLGLQNSLHRSRPGAVDVPTAVRAVHDAQLVRGAAGRARRGRAHRRLRHAGVLRHVLLRGVLPGIVTVGLFSFLASWNEFFAPLIFITDDEKFTLPVALFNLQSGSLGAVEYGTLLSGVVTAAVPCVLLFLLLQRYYVRGFVKGALKG